jgi:hypothetical protein
MLASPARKMINLKSDYVAMLATPAMTIGYPEKQFAAMGDVVRARTSASRYNRILTGATSSFPFDFSFPALS